MGIKFVREDTPDREGEQNDRAERTYRRSWTVEMESPTDGPELILSPAGVPGHPSLPRRFDPYRPASGESDEGSLCQTIRIAPKDRSRLLWMYSAYYTTRTDPTQFDPLERPADISYSGLSVAQPVVQDIYGRPLRNSTGDPFDPPPDDDEGRQSLRIIVNRTIADPAPDGWDPESDIESYNSVNLLPFRVRTKLYKKRHVKFKRSSAVSKWENGFEFWQVTYEFEIKKERIPGGEDGSQATVKMYGESGEELVPPVINAETSYAWTRFILDRGFRILKNGRRVVAVDDRSGQFYSTPPLLNGAGQVLGPTKANPIVEKPVYIGFDTLPGVDFSPFGLFM